MTDFPYSMFPIKLIHMDGKDKKTCWFQFENHMDKYIDKMKLNPKDYEVFTNNVQLQSKKSSRKKSK